MSTDQDLPYTTPPVASRASPVVASPSTVSKVARERDGLVPESVLECSGGNPRGVLFESPYDAPVPDIVDVRVVP